MKISSQSWHYRFNRLVQGHSFSERARRGQFTTCSYIRTIIFSMISGATKALVVAIISALLATAIISAIVVPILVWFTSVQPAEPFVGFAVFMWIVVAVVLLFITTKYTKDAIKKVNWTRKPKEPNLFIQAIKDKHNKFCTRVEVA